MPRDPLGSTGGTGPLSLDEDGRATLQGWLLLGLGSLAVAGVLVLLFAFAQTPSLHDYLPTSWQDFFSRALVTHVVFSFIVWFLSMMAALTVTICPTGIWGRAGLFLALAGAAILVFATVAGLGTPSLNNYVPVLRHPVYMIGLGLFAAGVALPILRLLIAPPRGGDALALGIGSAGLVYLVALVCVAQAWLHLTPPVEPEALFWGGGHVLQFSYTLMLVTGWQVLGTRTLGRAPLPPTAWRLVCALLVLGGLAGPPLLTIYSPSDPALRLAFTHLYMIVMPVPATIAVLATATAIVRGRRDWRSPAFLGLFLSVVMFALGGVAGFFVNGVDIRTPGHYHAEIGGLNLILMGLIFAVLLPEFGTRRAGWAMRWQFWLYFIGQSIFASGLFVAGGEGVPRKVEGAAQNLDTAVKQAGRGIADSGDLLAVAGGVMFIWLALSWLLARREGSGPQTR